MEYLGNIYQTDKKDTNTNGIINDEKKQDYYKIELACWIDGCGAKACGIKIW